MVKFSTYIIMYSPIHSLHFVLLPFQFSSAHSSGRSILRYMLKIIQICAFNYSCGGRYHRTELYESTIN